LGKKKRSVIQEEIPETHEDEGEKPASSPELALAEATTPEIEIEAIDKSKITIEEADKLQAEMNLGTCGHVDHGKTTLTQALTGVRTDRYSEEVERGISIKLGYADTIIARCSGCAEPDNYWTKEMIKQEYLKNEVKEKDFSYDVCPVCKGDMKFLRKISFVDSPGHEILMATMLSGASLMDGALLLIAADEKVPQPQTREHLAALGIMNIKHIVIVQNKVDINPKEKTFEHYQAIKEFIQGSVAEEAPIVPVSAVFHANLHELVMYIEK
jgi:translation initiation factor 2 subunit 3